MRQQFVTFYCRQTRSWLCCLFYLFMMLTTSLKQKERFHDADDFISLIITRRRSVFCLGSPWSVCWREEAIISISRARSSCTKNGWKNFLVETFFSCFMLLLIIKSFQIYFFLYFDLTTSFIYTIFFVLENLRALQRFSLMFIGVESLEWKFNNRESELLAHRISVRRRRKWEERLCTRERKLEILSARRNRENCKKHGSLAID